MGNSTSHVGSENTSSEGTRWKSGKTFVVDPVYAATAAGADDATSSPPLVDSSGKSYNDGGFGENHTWMTHSYRSVQSSTGKSTSSSQVVAASLHTNLMRSHRQKDPMK